MKREKKTNDDVCDGQLNRASSTWAWEEGGGRLPLIK